MKEVVVGTERISIGELIGKGGEGEVFALNGRPGQAVKIYNANLRNGREAKVRAMVAERLATKTDLVAYPRDVVSGHRGEFLGFLMRLVSGYRPVHELYSPKSRRRHFPNSDYRFIVRSAINVVRAVGKVHQTGCVIGDLNHSGILVAKDATVALIDADSFQFQLNGKTFPCVVGVPEFTPPELHGVSLDSTRRAVEHDNFGLAVAVFHLLFMGRHPYAGRFNGPDISMGEAISQNRFAFSRVRQSQTQTQPPPGALTLEMFPEAVSNAFEKAFGLLAQQRPGAAGWIEALTKLETSLKRCQKVDSHYYPSSASKCVWCELGNKTGFDMFPDLKSKTFQVSTDSVGTEAAIREIFAFRLFTLSDLLTFSPTINHQGSAALVQAQAQVIKDFEASQKARAEQLERDKSTRWVKGALIAAGASAATFFSTELWLIWVGMAGWGLASVFKTFSGTPATLTVGEVSSSPFVDSFSDADERVQRALDALVLSVNVDEILKTRDKLSTTIATYRKHDSHVASELEKLRQNREYRQRIAYLDQFPIRNANISGLGDAKRATLMSFGIETAADIEEAKVLRVPGFGEVFTKRLVDWRRTHERRFRFNPARSIQDQVNEKNLQVKLAKKKASLEADIRAGLSVLRRSQVLVQRARSDVALTSALQARAQAERDLQILGVAAPISKVTLKVKDSSSTFVPNCPKCGSQMVRRTARHGSRRFQQFWGCQRFPACNGTR